MGVGFAIPSDMAHNVMESIIRDGQVTRGFLGAMIQDLDSDLAKSFDYDSTDGVLSAMSSKTVQPPRPAFDRATS